MLMLNALQDRQTDLLDSIDSPADLRRLPPEVLARLAAEIRHRIIRTVAATGGHLAPSLGVVELTIALHYVFNTPEDKLIWDVGHQCLCPQAAHRPPGQIPHPSPVSRESAAFPNARRATMTPWRPATVPPRFPLVWG